MHTVASLKKGSPVKFIEQETKTEDYDMPVDSVLP